MFVVVYSNWPIVVNYVTVPLLLIYLFLADNNMFGSTVPVHYLSHAFEKHLVSAGQKSWVGPISIMQHVLHDWTLRSASNKAVEHLGTVRFYCKEIVFTVGRQTGVDHGIRIQEHSAVDVEKVVSKQIRPQWS